MPERRKVARFNLQVPARIEFQVGRGKRDVLTLTTRDISSSGVYLRTKQPLPSGVPVKLDVLLWTDFFNRMLSEGERVRVRVQGKVVRSDSDGMAIAFDGGYKISSGQHVRER